MYEENSHVNSQKIVAGEHVDKCNQLAGFSLGLSLAGG